MKKKKTKPTKELIYLGKGKWRQGSKTFTGEDIDGKIYEKLDDLIIWGVGKRRHSAESIKEHQ